MKSLQLAAILCVLARYSALANFTPPYPCYRYSVKASKLFHCSTASDFCTDYLHGTGSFTHTMHAKTTVDVTKTETDTSTAPSATSYTSTITDTKTSTSTTPSTTTTTTTAPACAIDDNKARSIKANGKPSCGIVSYAHPSKISAACNCILAKSTTVTHSVTKKVLTTTIVSVTSTITTDTTTTTTTTTTTESGVTTATVCTPCPSFYLEGIDVSNGNRLGYLELTETANDTNSYSVNAYDPTGMISSMTAQFALNGTDLLFEDPSLGNIHPDGTRVLYFDGEIENGYDTPVNATIATCSIDSTTSLLSCFATAAPGAFYACPGGLQQNPGCEDKKSSLLKKLDCVISKPRKRQVMPQLGADLELWEPNTAPDPSLNCVLINLLAHCTSLPSVRRFKRRM